MKKNFFIVLCLFCTLLFKVPFIAQNLNENRSNAHEICIGDANNDGSIDLLDINAFIEILTSGEFAESADINSDGEVNLLDINLFVLLITSGATCDECPTCIGDVNKDGFVTLLDIRPFVDIITSGEFKPCADINGDGDVNLLDIDPLVDIVVTNGGKSCFNCDCPGDINGDGVVNLLDVAPFVQILDLGIQTVCADIDGDGVVGPFDVPPFVALIESGATCNGFKVDKSSLTNTEGADNILRDIFAQLQTESPNPEIQLFPNPASDILNVELSLTSGAEATLQVYNISGQKVLGRRIFAKTDQNAIALDIRTLTTGLYFMEIDNGTTIQKRKFLVSKE